MARSYAKQNQMDSKVKFIMSINQYDLYRYGHVFIVNFDGEFCCNWRKADLRSAFSDVGAMERLRRMVDAELDAVEEGMRMYQIECCEAVASFARQLQDHEIQLSYDWLHG